MKKLLYVVTTDNGYRKEYDDFDKAKKDIERMETNVKNMVTVFIRTNKLYRIEIYLFL